MSCRLTHYLRSSIGKKFFMGLTGLLLCGFLVTHLLGNFLIICGPKAFNLYAYKLTSNPMIIPMEIGLALLFLAHIGMGLILTLQNKAARPTRYYKKVHSGRGATFASSTMPISGLIILVFLILHLIHFRFGPVYSTVVDGVSMRDLHRLVLEIFAQPGYLAWYLFAHVVLGIHVSHGFASAFQSLGFNHPYYSKRIKLISYLYAAFITIGFSTIAVWAYLQGAR